jgi:hypothetical protein
MKHEDSPIRVYWLMAKAGATIVVASRAWKLNFMIEIQSCVLVLHITPAHMEAFIFSCNLRRAGHHINMGVLTT